MSDDEPAVNISGTDGGGAFAKFEPGKAETNAKAVSPNQLYDSSTLVYI